MELIDSTVAFRIALYYAVIVGIFTVVLVAILLYLMRKHSMGMDREKWLAIRNTPRKTAREKMIHQSTNYVNHEDIKTGERRTIKKAKGNTFKRPNHARGT